MTTLGQDFSPSCRGWGSEGLAFSQVLGLPTKLGTGNGNGKPHWATESHGNPALSSKHGHMGL